MYFDPCIIAQLEHSSTVFYLLIFTRGGKDGERVKGGGAVDYTYHHTVDADFLEYQDWEENTKLN